jgi:4-aminobutyrate aminotransferase-like enzyme/Ser/Thr protein kinase RdoA (MazF antagonist)
MTLLDFTPRFSTEEAVDLARDLYGLALESREILPGERDQNFLLADASGDRYVLKVSSAREEREFLDAQDAMMRHVARHVDVCPTALTTVDGRRITQIDGADGRTHLVRLVTFLEGDTLASVRYRCPELLRNLGRRVGQMDAALADFDHAALHRDFHWDLVKATEIIASDLGLISDDRQRELIERLVKQFELHSTPLLERLPRSVIHNDANDGNVIVRRSLEPAEPATEIVGLIDFGDAVYSWTVGDLGIAVAYGMLGQSDPLSAAAEMVRGYHGERPLEDDEIAAIWGLTCMRLCVSAVMAAVQQAARPGDPYLTVSQDEIREILPRISRVPYGFATAAFRSACGEAPVPNHDAVCAWLDERGGDFAFPIERDATNDRFAVLDLGVESHLLGSEERDLDEPTTTRVIFDELAAKDATIGVGRYLEPRLGYTSRAFAKGDGWHEDRRTIHLGMDLFAPAGTMVRAPLDGSVHSIRERIRKQDYGTVVLLRHSTDDGDEFFTLYGHLGGETGERLQIGQAVAQGDAIGWLGDVADNGGWTPHLHFQIILDLFGLDDDFPGVAHASNREIWSALSPDPNRILGIPEELFPTTSPPKDRTLAARRQIIGRNLSVGYRDPVKIVRGWKQYLYDDTGRRYIDAYNNIPHVGHCHPVVVDAARRQLELLNTNTRYLSDRLTDFAARLTATMPDPLSVCFVLNSASEANELALRLARAYTRQKDLIVLEGGYHGNTTTMIDISPYKHDGPGGVGAPAWVHTAPVADIYRGEHRDPQTAGRAYADELDAIIGRLNASGRGLCGYIAESCPSVGGQIIFPDGYLPAVYEKVRAAGGVCIADDVQTGYGRLGDAFYGFELQRVVPDIVVLGKPIGNGHPLAALVTTPQIADAFDNGMEFFSSFGGNTVSCAVGMAVLEVLERENLQAHALEVGTHLLSRLEELKGQFEIIGDVRGHGLFLGIELVRDHDTLEPAAQEASFVANRMRDRGVLLGTDGPAHNVVKIRPPMPFSIEDADALLEKLSRSFEEL